MSSQQDVRQTNRRDFVLACTGLTAAGWAALSSQTFGAEAPSKPLIQLGDTVLFQGDSITDAGRKRDLGNDRTTNRPWAAAMPGWPLPSCSSAELTT